MTKITQSKITKYYISDIKGCDPISVYTEDFEIGKGQITIKCYNEVWSSFWPAMGDRNILEFFFDCDKYYLLKNLLPYDRVREPDIEKTIENLKDRVIEARKDESLSKEEAREFWDSEISGHCGLESLGEIKEIEHWCNNNYKIDGAYIFEEWWEAIENRLTGEAAWLRDTIIPIVQKELKSHTSKTKSNRNIRSKIMVDQHTLEELLNMKVDTKNKDGMEMKITPEFRVAVQDFTPAGTHIIIHPMGCNGETLDFLVSGDILTAMK